MFEFENAQAVCIGPSNKYIFRVGVGVGDILILLTVTFVGNQLCSGVTQVAGKMLQTIEFP
jgi:hypothetical protein